MTLATRTFIMFIAAIGLAACSGQKADGEAPGAEAAAAADATEVDLEAVLASSFRARGQASLDRLQRNDIFSRGPDLWNAARLISQITERPFGIF